jgi:hypothetical protein
MPAEMATLARDLAAETAVTRGLVAGLDEAGWRTPTPAAGWDIADQIGHLAYFDEAAVCSAVRPAEFHAALADALGISREPTERLRHVAHLGVGARAFSYAIRGKPQPPDPVRVELAAPDGALWTWGPAEAEHR